MKLTTPKWILIGSVIATIILYIMPFGRLIAYPLILISTMAHEFGHGIAALIVGAHFDAYNMWPDGSGQALIRSHSGALAQSFISAGGLVGPSIAAAGLFIAAAYPKFCRTALYLLATFLVVGEIFVIRGAFAMAFAGFLAFFLFMVAKQRQQAIAQTTLVFIAVQLALSVFSRGDYLFTRTAMTANGPMPSDVMQIEQALWLPYWFWGILCTLFSLSTLLIGLRFYIKKS